MNAGHKDATREDNAGVSLGVYNCGGDGWQPEKLITCRGDDEVVNGGRSAAIRPRDNAGDSAATVAIHSVSSLARNGCDSSCSSCRSSCGLVKDAGSRQIAFSI